MKYELVDFLKDIDKGGFCLNESDQFFYEALAFSDKALGLYTECTRTMAYEKDGDLGRVAKIEIKELSYPGKLMLDKLSDQSLDQ